YSPILKFTRQNFGPGDWRRALSKGHDRRAVFLFRKHRRLIFGIINEVKIENGGVMEFFGLGLYQLESLIHARPQFRFFDVRVRPQILSLP
ncbi:hypothetical protein ACEV76_24800, partial [Vibrio parahaemolyticus]